MAAIRSLLLILTSTHSALNNSLKKKKTPKNLFTASCKNTILASCENGGCVVPFTCLEGNKNKAATRCSEVVVTDQGEVRVRYQCLL